LLSEIAQIVDASDLCGFDVGERPQFPRGHPFRFVSGRLADVTGSFDLITMSHSIQYVRDIDGLFADIRRLVKPSGKIFVQVPDFSVKPASLLLGDLYYHYTRAIIDNVLRHAGFQAQFLTVDYFPRDVLVIASQQPLETFGYAASADELSAALSRLADFKERVQQFATLDGVAVLGTTIDAAFVDECLSSKVTFFVDENPRKAGTTFHGKAVVHPRAVAEDDVVLIPMSMSGSAIRDRLSTQYRGQYRCV
jgi:SAM-dependent methyltransferase